MHDIITATIGAAATIAVAIINRKENRKSAPALPSWGGFPWHWMIAAAALSAVFFAAALEHPELVHGNFLLVPLVAAILILLRPIAPVWASLATLALFSLNVTAGFLGAHITHAAKPFTVFTPLFAAGWAGFAFVLSHWRVQFDLVRRTDLPANSPAPARRKRRPGIAADVKKLADLRRSGILSTGEFSSAIANSLHRGRARRIAHKAAAISA